MQRVAAEPASATLHDEAFFRRPPYALAQKSGARPLLVLFERTHCASCDELHRDAFRRREVTDLIVKFDVVRLTPKDGASIVTPAGRQTTIDAWSRELNIAYFPTLVFFDDGAEVFRVESFARPFHLASALDYVASGAYRKQPSFQRFIQARADDLRARGYTVDLMK
jgi:thioredoxin-related protein